MAISPPAVLRAALLSTAFVACGCANEPTDLGELFLGAHRVAELVTSDETHRYSIDLAADTALRLRVDQSRLDVVLRVRGPAGEPLTVDSPTDRHLSEALCWVAESPGRVVLEVEPFRGSGSYSLDVDDIRPATEIDRSCAAAQRAFVHAQGMDSADGFASSARDFESADERLLAAVAWREAGSSAFRSDRPVEAIPHFDRGLRLARQIGSHYLETSLLNRLGLAYRSVEDLDSAAASFNEALASAIRSGDRRALATARTNLASIGTDLGDPHAAIDHLDRAIHLWRKLGELGEESGAHVARGTALATLGRYRAARDAFVEAEELARQTGQPARVRFALREHGWSLYLQGRLAEALARFEQAIELSKPTPTADLPVGFVDRLATILEAKGDVAGATFLRRSLLDRLDPEANPRNYAGGQLNLGCLLVDQDDLDEARQLIAEAGDFFSTSDDRATRAHLAYCQARLAHRDDARQKAIEYADQALDQLDQLRADARLQGQLFRPLRLWREYADLAIDLRLDGDGAHRAEASEIYDRTRAWALFEQVVRRRASADPGIDTTSLQPLQERINELDGIRRRLLQVDPAGAAKIEADLRRAAFDLDMARAKLRAEARRAGDLGSPKPATLAELRACLPDRSMVLAYRLGSTSSDVFAITRQTLDIWTLASRETLEAYAEAFYRSLESSFTDEEQWKLVARDFGRLVLPDGILPEGIDHVIVMADGLLHYVPFVAVASPRREITADAEFQTLGDDVSIAYMPSAAVFVALDRRRSERPAATDVTAFVDPVFTRDDDRLGLAPDPTSASSASRGITARRLPDGPLPRLPHTADEAAVLERLLPPETLRVLSGFDASKPALLASELETARLLHIATHAFIDEEVPELSGLILSRFSSDGSSVDGKLYLHEIQDLQLAADLTVLSGCQTALGQHVEGNGLLGLTQGFFDAGAARLLVTLWNVDDRAGSILMTAFYEHLLVDGLPPAEALRAAQRDLRHRPEYAAPYFWAQFALHGAP